MGDASATETAAMPTSSAASRPRNILMFCVGPLVAWGAMLADRGNGWSPLLFLLFGIVTALVAEQWAYRGRRRPQRWTRRAAAVLGIAVASFLAAMYSIRDDPAATFANVFQTPPPSTVTHLRGWKQWYDGIDRVVAFDTDQATVDRLLSLSGGQGFEKLELFDDFPTWDAARQKSMLDNAILMPFFDMGRLQQRPMSQPRVWKRDPPPAPNGIRTNYCLIWDPPSGQAILVLGEH